MIKKQNPKQKFLEFIISNLGFAARKARGFTLVEMLVAMTVFALVSGVALASFFLALRTHRAIVAEKKVSENVNFAIEFMSRQMRVATKTEPGDCPGLSSGRFLPSANNTAIQFLNAQGDCVKFSLEDGSIKFDRDFTDPTAPPIELTSPQSAEISELKFFVHDNDSPNTQPRVTTVVRARGVGESEEAQGVSLDMQTTVTARELDTN